MYILLTSSLSATATRWSIKDIDFLYQPTSVLFFGASKASLDYKQTIKNTLLFTFTTFVRIRRTRASTHRK
jgi:hypothetical protein